MKLPVINVTGVPTHHYFVVNEYMNPIMRDKEGRIMVWTNRDEAETATVAAGHKTFMVVGMGDANWQLFQEEESHVVVKE